jgi:hypothetical protein
MIERLKELFTVIGLVAQLDASFLLAIRGFTHAKLRSVWLVRSGRLIVMAPGLGVTSALIGFTVLPFEFSGRSLAMLLLSLLSSIAWVPALTKHGLAFVDRAGERHSDLEVQQLNQHGLALLAVGFVMSALGVVL